MDNNENMMPGLLVRLVLATMVSALLIVVLPGFDPILVVAIFLLFCLA